MVHHVRGEKVVFGKGEIHPLDAMPSCDHDGVVVLAPVRRRSWTARFVKLFFLLFFLAVLGVTMAVPMKRQMINVEQLRFPSGIAAAETLQE